MIALRLTDIQKTYGDNHVLCDVNLTIEDGEFIVIVGPSGCGKTTLLRVIAGLETPDAGEIMLFDTVVNEMSPAQREVAMVFQSYALYPHLTVFKNFEFALKLAGMTSEQIQQRINEVAQTLSLSDYLDRRPSELSGGQRQRVALGRALVRKPRMFLFDEPLSNLDAALRMNTRIEIADLHRTLNTPILYVTHDQTEAMTLADRIVVMRAGRIEQIGAPLELYNTPNNRFVAGFIGSPAMNFIEPDLLPGLEAACIGVRPEHLFIAEDGRLSGKVLLPGQWEFERGAPIAFDFANADAVLFDAQGDRIVSDREAL
ncbi:carbohydrate ABC transporter ATP-binding protein (CUT1 family) [Loktanella sp. PT4BL]|jgi:multiple sugar transport system ATP-binding protein|uniref:ABC transporter ATP-binding protein n=1 Tax=Loktanella sp. PT4BL TaxID=2135611 RepID=UPI000D7607DF|nr:ABC transporter ATP-binding protein [Loktanella sp. PT4BL]PXW66175.1 carbohydrate ABC transporter ATP-binding protein (CUT1 family) [Loktanella sp. PT4BL]